MCDQIGILLIQVWGIKKAILYVPVVPSCPSKEDYKLQNSVNAAKLCQKVIIKYESILLIILG